MNLLSLAEGSSYHYSDNSPSLNDFVNKKIGAFHYKRKNRNIRIASTPNAALSPIVGDSNTQSFLILITDVRQSSIDIWKCTKEHRYDLEFQGRIPVEGLGFRSAIAVEHGGKDLKGVCGDVTCCNFYVSCLAKSTIRCFSFLTNDICNKVKEVATSNICHEDLKKPADMAVHSNQDGKTKIAVISDQCGRIFLFTKESYFNFVLLQIISPHDVLSNPTSVCFEFEEKLWLSSNNCLLACPSNEEDFTVCSCCGMSRTQSLQEKFFKAIQNSLAAHRICKIILKFKKFE